MSQIRRSIPRLAVLSVAAGAIVFSIAGIAYANQATVTDGVFASFAAGTGMQIEGRAQMVRTAGGKTIVTVHVEGLAPNTAYGSHVHKQACADGEADGHYRFDPAGPATPPNEIWPGFTTNAAGIGNGIAIVDGTAGATAVSVVVHEPGGAKIACADLG
jgi:hypothetical protein